MGEKIRGGKERGVNQIVWQIIFLNFNEHEVLILLVPTRLLDLEVIKRIDSVVTQPVLLGYLVLPDSKTPQLSSDNDQQVIYTKESLELDLLKSFNDVPDETAGTVWKDKRLVVHDQFLFEICVIDESQH